MRDLYEPDRLKAWAGEILGVDPTATVDQCRVAFYARLRACNFMPPPSLFEALEILTAHETGGKIPKRAQRTAILQWKKQLRSQVEAFANRYWEMKPDERTSRYKELRAISANDYFSRKRLHQLKPGLDVVAIAATNATEEQKRMGKEIEALYVLKPTERARQRREAVAAEGCEVETARKTFLDSFPEHARLDVPYTKAGTNNRMALSSYPPALIVSLERTQRPFAEKLADFCIKSMIWILIATFAIGMLYEVFSQATKEPKSQSVPQVKETRPRLKVPDRFR